MAKVRTAAVAASDEHIGGDGIRQPGGDVHAWAPGTNQTVCGLALSRSRLRRFPHVPFDFRATDVLTAEDQVGHICPRCVAATSRRGERPWTRTSPRP
ncbi:hypothetical protein [Couchioplanes azureus]|uniref:hypothetical protein n=1 Tax=Couchioplanes caeruleus TaxID=56438 RepID=UPI0016705DBC|nr:hypothetical protein [Couchioplanes caeruleus]GGQ87685.1 hypothetical protein GCM10010166_67310 [Couchioplanes caeruleus subsp. azureus]